MEISESRLNVKSKLQYEANIFALQFYFGPQTPYIVHESLCSRSPCLPLWPAKDRASTHPAPSTHVPTLPDPEPLPIPFLLPVHSSANHY